MDGAHVQDSRYYVNCSADENAGESGPPVEVLFAGETVTIRLEMTKWDPAVAAKLQASPGAVGTLMFNASKTVRVLLNTTSGPMNFPRCFLRNPWEINKGTKYSRLVLEFEAHRSGPSGGIFDDGTTTTPEPGTTTPEPYNPTPEP